jgi:hypothetical protein
MARYDVPNGGVSVYVAVPSVPKLVSGLPSAVKRER